MRRSDFAMAAAAILLAALAASPAAPAGSLQFAEAVAPPIPPAPVASRPAPARPGALDANKRALVERINAYLTSVHTLIGDFVQVGPDGKRSDGKFYLQKPGRVRFEYNPPSPLELVSDGRSVAIRDRKLATQDLLLLSQTPLRFLLSERIDLLKEGNLVDIFADEVYITVVLEEKHTLGGTHRLTLMFSTKDTQLKQWTVTDPQGYDTTVALYNLDSSKKPDPNLFRINYETFRN
ncbi:MAG TPA: outer-membrane lipoprotein carrier protein LolA [Xanthobacteraceae bacterium]|nr:outer-membrane lipoprotein carrier protein LolA [Xanthobacteraceae bacterium]